MPYNFGGLCDTRYWTWASCLYSRCSGISHPPDSSDLYLFSFFKDSCHIKIFLFSYFTAIAVNFPLSISFSGSTFFHYLLINHLRSQTRSVCSTILFFVMQLSSYTLNLIQNNIIPSFNFSPSKI